MPLESRVLTGAQPVASGNASKKIQYQNNIQVSPYDSDSLWWQFKSFSKYIVAASKKILTDFDPTVF